MTDPSYIYCHGIRLDLTPCPVRQMCQRHTRIKDLPFSVPASIRWHFCRGDGEHFVRVERDEVKP